MKSEKSCKSYLTGAFSQSVRNGLKPDPIYTVSEWSDEKRMLSSKTSAEAGRWRTSRTPYLREPMDLLSPFMPHTEIVFIKGTQIGGTECGNNFLGYVIDHAPAPFMYVMPTLEMAKRSSKTKIAIMLDATPCLKGKVKDSRSRDSGNTILMKDFEGGYLVMTGANSPAGLRSASIRYLYLDEIDAYEADVGGEGDPYNIAKKRTDTFKSKKKVFSTSTPTTAARSRIQPLYNKSDQRRYFVPCPDCGHMQTIEWKNIQWVNSDPSTARLCCEECATLIPEVAKTQMLAGGKWIAQNPDSKVAGFHLSALYSPYGWYSWEQAVEEFIEANRCMEEEADYTKLKTWTNTVLAEVWKDNVAEELDHSKLYDRAEDYTKVNKYAVLITAAVDTQDNRLEVELKAWLKGEESYSILYKVLWGDPANKEVWEDLEDIIFDNYEHESGGTLPVALTLIDSGGHRTQDVYKFCYKHRHQRVFAIKGRGGEGIPVIGRPTRQEITSTKRYVNLYPVSDFETSSIIFNRLSEVTEPGPGYMHYPKHYDEEVFKQVCAYKSVEVNRKGFTYYEFRPNRRRDEAWDLARYNLAAVKLLSPNWKKLQEKVLGTSKIIEKNEEKNEKDVKIQKKIVKNPRKPRNNWLNRYKQ